MWRHSDTWGFQIDQLTTSFPDKLVDGDMKLYYMLQCSFWLHVRNFDTPATLNGCIVQCCPITKSVALFLLRSRQSSFTRWRCGARTFCCTTFTMSLHRRYALVHTSSPPRGSGSSFWLVTHPIAHYVSSLSEIFLHLQRTAADLMICCGRLSKILPTFSSPSPRFSITLTGRRLVCS